MDFVTHAAVGALTGRAIAPDSPRAARWGALAALAPDADHVLEWVSAAAYLLHHRTSSHSLVTVALIIAAAAIPSAERRRRAGVVAAALGTHLLLDLSTPWGTGIGWPFTAAMPAWDILPIVCPWLLALSLGLAVFAWRRGRIERSRGARAARWSLVAIAAFVACEAGVAAVGRKEGVVLAVPDWRAPWSARGIRVEPQQVLIVDGAGSTLERYPGETTSPTAEPEVAAWLSRFRVPLRRPDGTIIDAQFSLVAPDRPPFRIDLDPPSLRMQPRGVQPLLWLAVCLAVVWSTREPAARVAGSEDGLQNQTLRGDVARAE